MRPEGYNEKKWNYLHQYEKERITKQYLQEEEDKEKYGPDCCIRPPGYSVEYWWSISPTERQSLRSEYNSSQDFYKRMEESRKSWKPIPPCPDENYAALYNYQKSWDIF